MENKKVCKVCSKEFKNYYFMKKHKMSEHMDNTIKNNTDVDNEEINSEYTSRKKDKYSINLSKLKLSNIEDINIERLNKKEKIMGEILFDYIYSKYLEEKIIDKFDKEELRKKLFNLNKDELMDCLKKKYNDIIFDEQTIYNQSNINLNVNIEKINILFNKNDFYFYKDPIIFPIIFYKKYEEYYEKLNDIEKNIINQLYKLKKHFYQDDDFIKMIEDNPHLIQYPYRCLFIDELMKKDKINNNEANMTKIFLNHPILQTTFLELMIVSKFKTDFDDFCSKNE